MPGVHFKAKDDKSLFERETAPDGWSMPFLMTIIELLSSSGSVSIQIAFIIGLDIGKFGILVDKSGNEKVSVSLHSRFMEGKTDDMSTA